MQQAMRAKIVQFKLQWISPFWFQSIKTQIVHLWWSLNLCNYFEDYWCLIIKPIHFLSYRVKSDFISVDKIFLTLTSIYFLSQVVGVRVLFLFFTCDTEKNTKAFISVSFDFYFERKGKREDYKNAFLSTTAILVRNLPGKVFSRENRLSVYFFYSTERNAWIRHDSTSKIWIWIQSTQFTFKPKMLF